MRFAALFQLRNPQRPPADALFTRRLVVHFCVNKLTRHDLKRFRSACNVNKSLLMMIGKFARKMRSKKLRGYAAVMWKIFRRRRSLNCRRRFHLTEIPKLPNLYFCSATGTRFWSCYAYSVLTTRIIWRTSY